MDFSNEINRPHETYVSESHHGTNRSRLHTHDLPRILVNGREIPDRLHRRIEENPCKMTQIKKSFAELTLNSWIQRWLTVKARSVKGPLIAIQLIASNNRIKSSLHRLRI